MAANALLYGVLSDAVALGKAVGKPTATFEAARTSLFGALNGRPSNLWDEEKGQCRRFPTRFCLLFSAVVLLIYHGFGSSNTKSVRNT